MTIIESHKEIMVATLYIDNIVEKTMPSQTYNIKFRQGDFFYNTADVTQNTELLATFPFKKEDVVIWANQAQPGANITTVVDIFDPKLSGIIMNPDYDFGNTFLPGNITFNDSFNKLTFDLTNPPPASSDISESSNINGQLTIKSTNPTVKDITLDVSEGSNIQWKQDATNSWKPEFSIDTELLSKNIPFTDTDGGKSYITVNTMNPRCKYRPTCTMKHWHYSGKCNTQIITNPDGTSYCKCVCTGVPVFDDNPHSHCDTYNLNPNGSASGPTGNQPDTGSLGLIQAIQGIKMNLTANFPEPQFGSAGENVTMEYAKDDKLNNFKEETEEIRKLIYQYYTAVAENIKLQKSLSNNSNKDVTMSQAMMDATVQYKTEYLNVFNIVVGVFCAGGYIYIMSKK
jgi:hypothetical protein